jgi:hypothetical protein
LRRAGAERGRPERPQQRGAGDGRRSQRPGRANAASAGRGRAANSGQTLSDYLLAELEPLAARPTRSVMLARIHGRKRVTLKTPAAIISSAMWGYTHNQYPLSLQALIMAVGVYFSWLMRKAQSLWTPYASHMVLDIVGDSLIG